VITHLFLRKIIGKVCNHDLVLGWDTIGRGSTLTSLTRSTVGCRLGLLVLGIGGGGLIGGFGQGEDLRCSWELCTLLTAGLLTS